MRGVVSLVVAVCLLAAGGARADESVAGSETHTSQLVGVSHALAAHLAPRRDGAGPDLRLAPFTLPLVAAAAAAARSIAAVAGRTSLIAVDDGEVPTRSSRGPPSSPRVLPSRA
jgi:hypothetical protein